MDARVEIEHVDVLVIGAGLSGIDAGYHLQTSCPDRSYAILEARDAIGGTWDLFRYPGIRSDSDMYTLGFPFRPWTNAKAIADGPSILKYVRDTAAEFGIDRKIRFRHRVTSANWDSATARWTLTVARGDDAQTIVMSCNFLLMCAGYYSYEAGYQPDFPGAADFQGRLVHPQHWPEGLDYSGKRVIVIGSGATAMTLVPEMSKAAAQVIMLQRSPTYVVSRPAEDAWANWMRDHLPAMLAYSLVRWRNVLMGMYFFRLARKYPKQAKTRLIGMVQAELGPDYDVGTHFSPSYNPWDQRICLVPDSDLFQAIKSKKAEVVTDHIKTFTADGILLESGRQLQADIIVTATGLRLQMMGGIPFTVDGRAVNFGKTFGYKGMMFNDVPNMASCFGYTNASWTLKCDLTCGYVTRLLNHMRTTGNDICMPHAEPGSLQEEAWLDFSSGYVTRARDELPKQATTAPWKLYQNYVMDLVMLKFGKVDDASMRFSKSRSPAAAGAVRVPQPV